MNRIRELREASRLSQADLGGLIGVASATVSQWELGKAIPRKRMAKALAKRLGVTVEGLGLEDRP